MICIFIAIHCIVILSAIDKSQNRDSKFFPRMSRTIIGIRNGNGMTVPKFSECLLEFFTKDNSVNVNYSLENGVLVLSESEKGHELRHSPKCPIKLSPAVTEPQKAHKRTPNIGVATSVVIESSDSHILLTKRPVHMRSSPNVWVIPGGHIEPGETVFEAGAREIKEEIHLDIDTQKASILGLWENVYPLLLGVGAPRYHILVIFLHTQLNESHFELTKKIVPNPEEVGSFCWLSSSVLNSMFSPNNSLDNLESEGKQYIYESGEILEKYLDYNSMFNKWLRLQPEPYSAVNFALRKWLQKRNNEHPFSKY